VRLKITNAVDTKLSGYGLPYWYAFLQAEAAKALKDYLDMRVSLEEGLRDDDDYIFKPILYKALNEKMHRVRVSNLVKSSARKMGLDPRSVWTHTLRKSFRKVLNASPIDEDDS